MTRTFAPVYTASTWLTAWQQMHKTMAARAPANAPGPPMTNAEVLAFVWEWHLLDASKDTTWAQYAARAYGWSPPTRTYLRRDVAWGKRLYPTVAADDIDTVDVWSWSKGIARDLDTRTDTPPPRVSVNKDAFADPVVSGIVKATLASDGLDAKFKVPLPTCKDKKTGKRRIPYPPCDASGRRRVPDGRGGLVDVKCDKPGDCDVDMVDDPITAAENSVMSLVLILGAMWLFTRKPRRRQRE